MKLFLILISLLIVGASNPTSAANTDKESVYDRVMRTGTIRCGYGLWSVYLSKDPNTGKMGGIYYDYMEALGKNLGLKIEWTEEAGWGNYITALENKRFDAFCTVVTLNAERARQADFLTPIFYMGSDIFVAEGDKRFDGNLAAINKPDVTMITYEGDIYSKISAAEFPKSRKFELPQNASSAELFSSLATHKGDVLLVDSSSAYEYMEKNPGKIRKAKLPSPFRASPEGVSIKGGEYRFQRMLDIATIELLTNGTIDTILKKYDPKGIAHIPLVKPYQMK